MKAKKRLIILLIYIAAFTFYIGKMFYYAEEMGGFPDEDAHVGYMLYLETHPGTIIPQFQDMKLAAKLELDEETGRVLYDIVPQAMNYLGHPPFYYHMLRLFAGCERVTVKWLYVDLPRLRQFNIFLSSLSMLCIFWLGYSRFRRYSDKILPHAVYAAAAVSIPMAAYNGAGVNNDNLVMLGVILFFAGILRYFEDKTDYLTYFLVGGGFFIAILSKLTAGEIVVVTLGAVVLADLVRGRKLSVFTRRQFWVTTPLYIVPILYYLFIYSRYGVFQPSLQSMNYDYYMTTTFYVPSADRIARTAAEYFRYYIKVFLYTWEVLYGNGSWVEKTTGLVSAIGPVLVLVLPVVQGIRAFAAKSKDKWVYFVMLAGFGATMVTQYISAYRTYLSAGYNGGIQARYYICLIVFFAYACGRFFITETKEGTKESAVMNALRLAAGSLLIGLLIYSDFVFYLLHYSFS